METLETNNTDHQDGASKLPSARVRRLARPRSPERTQARITAFNTAGYALKHLHKNDVELVLRALNLCYAKRPSKKLTCGHREKA